MGGLNGRGHRAGMSSARGLSWRAEVSDWELAQSALSSLALSLPAVNDHQFPSCILHRAQDGQHLRATTRDSAKVRALKSSQLPFLPSHLFHCSLAKAPLSARACLLPPSAIVCFLHFPSSLSLQQSESRVLCQVEADRNQTHLELGHPLPEV